MRKCLALIAGLMLFVAPLSAKSGKELADSLKIDPSSKAIRQWDRIFADPKKLAKIGVDGLSAADVAALKDYLIKHAADSDQPAVAGR